MSDGTNENKDVAAPQSRRDFVRTSAQVAVTAPAVAVLLSATTKPAKALLANYAASSLHILDDFTFGNDQEDIDSASFGNFNPLNGVANQDDHV
jgi:hypothetical protein